MTQQYSATDPNRKQRKPFFTRQNLAYFTFVLAIILVTVGGSFFHPGAGLVAGGLLLAVFSYLLGNNE